MNCSGFQYPKEVILQVVRYYVSYKLSYRDIEEIFTERGIDADHSTYNRWVIRFAPQIEMKARQKKRAVDKIGDIVDFYLSKARDENAARAFLRKAIGSNGLPHKVVIDKSGANALALHHINTLLWFSGVLMLSLIEVVDIKYLNNIVEQSHRPIKQKMVQALGWKSEAGALATMAGQETWTMIKRGQIMEDDSLPVWDRFYALAA